MESYLKHSDIESFEYVDIDIVYDITVEDNSNYFLDVGKEILVHNSGKTWSVCQWIIIYCLKNKGKTITIGRDKMTTLKKTLLDDIKVVITAFDLWPIIKYNRSEMHMELNGNLIRFVGLNDDIMAAHGLRQDVFWLNEAMSISRDTFDQLEQRTTEFFIIDYNPSTTKHWLYDLEKRGNVDIYKTTVLDNPFVPEQAKQKILSYEPTEQNEILGTADEFKWKVYGLGERAASEDTIFKKWQLISTMPKDYDLKVYGLDFGFSNDPSACVELIISGNNIYIQELLYSTGLINSEIYQHLKNIVDKNCYIVADSAEPKSIVELRKMQLNIIAAVKGADSVRSGIDKLKSYRIFIHEKSINLQEEFSNYQWAKGRDGENMNVPIDKYNHLIDATRYALTRFK